MARTRSPDYDNIRASILSETAALFASRGFAASSIGDIAEACGCSKSRLYHYFDSKEAILETMLSEHVDKLLTGAYALLAQHPDPMERFRALARFFMEIYAFSGDKHAVMLTCIEFLSAQTRKEVLAKQRELVSFVRAILKEIQPERGAGDSTADVDTMLFFGMINWTYTWYRPDGPVGPQELADRSLRIFLDGYRNAPPLKPKASAVKQPARRGAATAGGRAAAKNRN
jgi:AcrR family transcriptional regulator